MNKPTILLLVFSSYVSSAQVLLEGKILDKSTEQPIEFVNIIVSGSSLVEQLVF